MSLVENLQTCLARLRDRQVAFTLPSGEELAQLRRHLRARFEEFLATQELQRQEWLTRAFQDRLLHLEDVAFQICWSLDSLAINASERIDTLCAAIDFDLPEEMRTRLPQTGTSIVLWRASLSKLAMEARQKAPGRVNDWTHVRALLRYANELRLTRLTGNTIDVATTGEVLLRLTGRDAVRWLLAVEVTQSLGSQDPWRMSREVAVNLANMEPVWIHEPERPCFEETLERCLDFQLVRLVYEDPHDELTAFYEVTPLGRELLAEAGSQETPFTLLAQALAADQTEAVLASRTQSSPDTAAEATVRHARMVAHEIRNALVPVREALHQLWRDLGQHGQDALTAEPRTVIDGNIERIFRFVEDSVRLTHLPSTPREIFDLVPVIRDAIANLDILPRHPIEPAIAPHAEDLYVRGHRQRLVIALINLLRNAVQVGGSDVAIVIQLLVLTGLQRIQIIVDDNGPGIAPAERAKIFQNGVSHRVHGTGHGLTLVREVIEREMSGTIVCEASPSGGARFVIEIPRSQESV